MMVYLEAIWIPIEKSACNHDDDNRGDDCDDDVMMVYLKVIWIPIEKSACNRGNAAHIHTLTFITHTLNTY